MAEQEIDFRATLPPGSKVKNITIEGKEDPQDKKLRLRREFWSFLVKELAAYVVSFAFLILIGGYCCFVVVRNGVASVEARTVFPMLTTLFGGVVGLIIGKASK